MLWSRCTLSRSSCASRFKRSAAQPILYINNPPAPQAPFAARDARSLYRHWLPPQTYREQVGEMAPKQATLGYVKSGQQTLGCGAEPSVV